MELLIMVLMLLMLIGISNVINRFVPFVPVPLIQIALGVAAAYIPVFHRVPLNPELFLVLFIAPLLFNDGKMTPRNELWRLRVPILLLALGLVFATILVAGPFIHWLIPAIPLSAAFALAAILSPTDAVAVGSLSGRAKLPRKIMRLLEGEALMNDASGLVAFNFAIAATVTGYFSLPEAIGSFIVVAVGGLLIGALLGFAVIWLRLTLRRLGIEDVSLHMLIVILTPFIIYLAAEECHFSGILAVVAAGVTHAVERDRMESASIKLRVVSESTWSVILFSLNGLVFVLLGLEIPDVVGNIWKDPHYRNGQVIGYILLITAVLIALRFVWVLAIERHARTALLTAVSGVRGALTLAAAFSTPMLLAGGRPFPERNLILFICAGVILLTLILASVLLPPLTRDPNETTAQARKSETAERKARIRALEAGLCSVREEITDDNKEEAFDLIAEYNRRMQYARLQGNPRSKEAWRKTVTLRLEGIQAERRTVERWEADKRIPPDIALKVNKSLNRTEVLLTNRLNLKLIALIVRRALRRLFSKKRFTPGHPGWEPYKEMRLEAIREAVATLKALKDEGNKDAVLSVIAGYREMEQHLLSGRRPGAGYMAKKHNALRRELELKALQAERNEIQEMFERREIDRTLAGTLRLEVNYREAGLFDSEIAH
ncbi:Na+/H+ antiporter [Paenibacillus thailandensis]|uniref:Na+/H+ antiporter n=1 Tax=Paenibacillus thailandensis TaxID=393250 RepID=A0ABW5QUA6_9BACL